MSQDSGGWGDPGWGEQANAWLRGIAAADENIKRDNERALNASNARSNNDFRAVQNQLREQIEISKNKTAVIGKYKDILSQYKEHAETQGDRIEHLSGVMREVELIRNTAMTDALSDPTGKKLAYWEVLSAISSVYGLSMWPLGEMVNTNVLVNGTYGESDSKTLILISAMLCVSLLRHHVPRLHLATFDESKPSDTEAVTHVRHGIERILPTCNRLLSVSRFEPSCRDGNSVIAEQMKNLLVGRGKDVRELTTYAFDEIPVPFIGVGNPSLSHMTQSVGEYLREQRQWLFSILSRCKHEEISKMYHGLLQFSHPVTRIF